MDPLRTLDPRRTLYLRLIEGEGGGGGGDGTTPGDNPPPAAVQFTEEQQAAIDRIVQGRVAQAQRSARQSAEQEIKDYLDEQKRLADLADADEITRLKAEKEAAEAAAAKAAADAKATATRAAATTALLAAGLNPANVEDGVRLIDLDAEDLAAEVTQLKDRLPALFGTGEGTPPPPPPNLTPPGSQPSGQGAQTAAEKAAAMRSQVFPHRKPAA